MTSKDKTKSLVNKATTDDRNPPSGYLLKELAARTMQINECQTIEDLIVKKLAKNKPYIKYKALRVVKFLCETGSHNWRRAWQRNTDKLRDAQQFRGPPDPIYGDAPYQQVRKAAKDAMQAVFAQNVVDNTSIRSKIKGIGGDNAYSSNDTGSSFKPPTTFGSGSKGTFGGSSLSKNKAPSAPGGGWGKRMEGHGNTNYTPSVSAKSYQPHTTKPYMNPANLSGSPSHSTHKLDTRGLGKKRKKKKVGGIWGNSNDDDVSEEEEEDYTQYEPEETSFGSNSQSYSVPKASKRNAFGGQIKKGTTSSGQYEKRWVDDIVKSGGVGCKIVDLPKFVAQFENLSKSHVLGYLDEKLEDSSWQKQGKALALIEAMLKGKSGDDVVEYFTQSPDNVQSLVNAKKSILRKKANAVMKYLDVEEEDDDDDDEEEEEEEEEEVEDTRQRQSVGNLLGDDHEEEEDDMFDGLQTHEDGTTGTTDLIGNDMFSDMDKKQNGGSSGNIGNSDDLMNLMGDMDMNQSNGGNNGNAPAMTQSGNETKKPYQDIFADITGSGGGTQPPPNTATNAAATKGGGGGDGGDLSAFFGGGGGGGNMNMNMNGNANGNTSGGTQSAFGFDIGGSTNAPPPQQQQPVAAASNSGTASAFGFNLGSADSTAMNAVQQSPAQQPSRSMNASASSMNSSSAFGFDLGDGQQPQSQQQQQQPMMTTSMLAQNNQINQNMMSQMSQMQQMQSMMAQMQTMNMTPNVMAQMNQMRMNQGNMMGANMNQMNMMQQPPTQQSQLFAQALQGVNGQSHAQQQAPKSAYRSNNDPFSGLTGGSQTAQTTQAPTQPPQPKGPDPFAQFGLNSMQ